MNQTSIDRDALADWIIRRPLPIVLGLLCLAQLVTWIPHYLTWPYFVDHDVFATLAFEWDAGILPYRDAAANNFPGTIYLHSILGRVFGWGRTAPMFAADAGLVLLLGVTSLVWSRRRFGRYLPGLVGYAAFLSYYLGLDHSLVAQRDWHAPLAIVLAIMAVEIWPGLAGFVGSALGFAVGFSIRPQVVLFLPALLFSVAGSQERSLRARAYSMAIWSALAGLFVVLAFVPILSAGLWPDFVGRLKLVGLGSDYNQSTLGRIARELMLQGLHAESLVVPLLIGLFLKSTSSRTPMIWLLALCGAWLYKPLSPVPWPYLAHPLMLVLAMNLSVLASLLLDAPRTPSTVRLAAVTLLLLAGGITARPAYCSLSATRLALVDRPAAGLPTTAPPGTLAQSIDPNQPPYAWDDYRAALLFLKTETRRSTRIANLLRMSAPLTGPSARRSALPAESLAWLVVKLDDESAFARALSVPGDTLALWAPDETLPGDTRRLAPALRRLSEVVRAQYHPVARFGRIEVWQRNP